MMYLSKPSIVCASGDENALLNSCISGTRHFSKLDILGHELYLGAINFALADFKHNTDEKFKTRTNALALHAVLKLDSDIRKAIKKYGKDRVGVIIATTNSGINESYKAFENGSFDTQNFIIEHCSLSNTALFIREFYGLKSVCYGVSSACTSGIKAFKNAKDMIKLGVCDAVICGGADDLNPLSILGFNSLCVLSDRLCKPFSKDRDGINIGEGACMFLMCKDEISNIKLKSVLSNCDAYHITQPNLEATQQISLINNLLNTSNLKEVEYINLHATGTMANDKMEAKAINATLKHVLASGIKANIGHTLGACGAIEAGLCVMAIENGISPIQILDEYDSELESINISQKPTKMAIKNALNLSFAFGGDNAGMIIGVSE